jgi:ribosomal protein S20
MNIIDTMVKEFRENVQALDYDALKKLKFEVNEIIAEEMSKKLF